VTPVIQRLGLFECVWHVNFEVTVYPLLTKHFIQSLSKDCEHLWVRVEHVDRQTGLDDHVKQSECSVSASQVVSASTAVPGKIRSHYLLPVFICLRSLLHELERDVCDNCVDSFREVCPFGFSFSVAYNYGVRLSELLF
jgi:hypothetical protein